MFRILLIDDHAVVRAGLKEFLAESYEAKDIGEAATAEAAIEQILTSDYDIALLDISLSGSDGIEVLKYIKQEKPSLPVLVISMHPESRYAAHVLRLGASGYLQKEVLPTELLNAIRTIRKGKRYISASLAQLLASDLEREDSRPLHETLSERERQVFMGLARGKQVSALATELNLNIKTISTYRTRVLEKMKFSSNSDLTYYAIKNGLID